MSDTVLATKPHADDMRDAATTAEFLEGDRSFSAAIQAAVATKYLSLRDAITDDIKPFPAELADAALLAAAEYERAVDACRGIPKGATLDDLAGFERKVNEARTAMRYRANQILVHLGLADWCDWDGFDSIRGWKAGDYSEDRVVPEAVR